MRSRFIGDTITVALDEARPGKPPVSFVWGGDTYLVDSVEATWADTGWGPLRARPKRWWQRRHRTYFQVSARGQTFEIYHDRPSATLRGALGVAPKGRGLGTWTLYRLLAP